MTKKDPEELQPKKRILKNNGKNAFYYLGGLVVLALIILSLTFSIYHVSYAKKILPGVHAAGVDLGGLTPSQALEVLKKNASDAQEITLQYNDDNFEFSSQDISLSYNWEATVKKAYSLGRKDNFLINSTNKIVGLITPLTVKADFDYDSLAFDTFLAKISTQINQPGEDAAFELSQDDSRDEKTVLVRTSKIGKEVDRAYLLDELMTAFAYYSFEPIQIEVKEMPPLVHEDDLQKFQPQVAALVEKPILVAYGEKVFTPTAEEIMDFVTVHRKGGKVSLDVNQLKLQPFLEKINMEVYRAPRGQVKELEGKKVVSFELTEKGQEIDKEVFSENFKQALLSGERTVDVPVKEISGPKDAQRYGIYELLGSGESKFAGSAVSRENNLILAAERASGVLVPPEGVFSFNNSVGDISAATGYDSAYIISGGRTVLGDGGGVCQTSTTLFRAVLNAGLPVVTRHPHIYRVTYYEQESPVGFDASIYQPSLDFKFKNDTPGYILVQASWNREAKTLTFNLYGTPDNRKVQITDPVVTNVVPPPEPLYQDDPDLPKGTTKQVDFAAWGATASFTRVVSKNGKVMFEDTYTSHYRPWQAVYLVGTKKD